MFFKVELPFKYRGMRCALPVGNEGVLGVILIDCDCKNEAWCSASVGALVCGIILSEVLTTY